MVAYRRCQWIIVFAIIDWQAYDILRGNRKHNYYYWSSRIWKIYFNENSSLIAPHYIIISLTVGFKTAKLLFNTGELRIAFNNIILFEKVVGPTWFRTWDLSLNRLARFRRACCSNLTIDQLISHSIFYSGATSRCFIH